MHELGLAEEIYRVCRRSLESHGEGRVRSVHLAVGELSAVEPELLRYAWQAVTEGGPDTGARLEIEWCRAHQRCSACGAEGDRGPGHWLSVCPSCGGLLQTKGGRQLDVIDLDIELSENGTNGDAVAAGAPLANSAVRDGGSFEEDR